MATVSSVTKHFPSAKEGFVTTLASTISSGAATVPLNSVTGYNNGEVAVFIVEPGTASAKQAVTGTIDTAGVQLTNCVWTEGTNQTHNAGSTVVDYVAATHMSMVSKGLLVEHKQTGAHSDITADSIVVVGDVEAASFTITGSGGNLGWLTGLPAPDSVTHNGQRSYDLVFNGTDLTDTVNIGTPLRFGRTVTAPIQCADLEASSSQYFNDTSVSGTTFTDDFCAGAWVKLESLATMSIVSRWNGTSGFVMDITSTGLVRLVGYNAGAANFSLVQSYQTPVIGRWVHIAAQLDMSAFTATSTTSYIMFDGQDTPASVARGGTNPTALVQAGDLNVGADNSLRHFDGKLSNVFYSSAKITQANMRTLSGQSITSALCTTHSIVSAYTLNNTLNDVNTTSANNLTAQGSAAATNADSPFSLGSELDSAYTDGTTEFGIVTKTAFSTNTTLTVQVPEGCALPTSGGITSVFYSPDKAPYGFPTNQEKWAIVAHFYLQQNTGAVASASTVTNLPGGRVDFPVGQWNIGYDFMGQITHVGATFLRQYLGMSNANNNFAYSDFIQYSPAISVSITEVDAMFTHNKDFNLTSATSLYLNSGSNTTNTTQYYNGVTGKIGKIYAKLNIL